MRKPVLILLLFCYTIGSLCTPLGDFSFMPNLSSMYKQCSEEDPDLNPADFVFEHLLNLEDVMSYFESGDDDGGEKEKPHAPFQSTNTLTSVVVMPTKAYSLELTPVQVFASPLIIYPLHNDRFLPNTFYSEIFHPPAV